MNTNIQKEEFSYAYIYAIASAAGYSFQRTITPLDQLGIDLMLTGIGVQGTMGIPQLYLQVKSTSREIRDRSAVKYPLRVKNYEELRKCNQYPPLILVVVIIPDNLNEWISQSQEELCLKNCGYWISLSGASETKNQDTVTVSIPRDNLFSVNALRNIMQCIANGENL